MKNCTTLAIHTCHSYFLANAYPAGLDCYDFFKLGIIPNPGSDQCLDLYSITGKIINCCYNSIIPSDDQHKCPENSLGIENHCYTMNRQNSSPLNETILDSEAECQRNGGNLIQFSSTNAIDLMTDIFMSHPRDSFVIVNDSFHVGVFANPHFPFISTSSSKKLLNMSVDPRYLNETANELGACTAMNYSPTFNEYMDESLIEIDGQKRILRLESTELTNKTEPGYWKPKHTMELIPKSCEKEAYSICDHRQSIQGVAYNLSSSSFMSTDIMKSAVGFYIHPMNSLSACIAYCISKEGTAMIIIYGKTCICAKGYNDRDTRIIFII